MFNVNDMNSQIDFLVNKFIKFTYYYQNMYENRGSSIK